MAALLKFPSVPQPESRKTELVFNFRPKPVLSKFEKVEAEKLLATAQRVESGMKALLEFTDSHREDARLSGIETIAVELASERAALENAVDALEDGVKKNEGVFLSENSLALMRRLEKLIAEASSNISRFSGKPSPVRSMGQAAAAQTNDLLIPAIFFGLIALSVIAIAAWTTPRK
jgi:hypothetical protein